MRLLCLVRRWSFHCLLFCHNCIRNARPLGPTTLGTFPGKRQRWSLLDRRGGLLLFSRAWSYCFGGRRDFRCWPSVLLLCCLRSCRAFRPTIYTTLSLSSYLLRRGLRLGSAPRLLRLFRANRWLLRKEQICALSRILDRPLLHNIVLVAANRVREEGSLTLWHIHHRLIDWQSSFIVLYEVVQCLWLLLLIIG